MARFKPHSKEIQLITPHIYRPTYYVAWIYSLSSGIEIIWFDFTTVGSGANRTAALCKILAEDWEQWRAIWTRLGEGPAAPWRQHSDLGELPRITSGDISRAAAAFKPTTSVGIDSLPPRNFQWLPQPLQAVATFLNQVEATGTWPTAISDVLLHFMP